MGNYLNPGNENFFRAVNSEIYVDKSELIRYTNKVLNTMQQYICVSRPRLFGKSMTVNMLTAYYSKGCNSKNLFEGLKIAEDEHFETYRNRYDTISLNMQEFLSQSSDIDGMISLIEKTLLTELLEQYPTIEYFEHTNIITTMQDVYQNTKNPFIIVIDDWDCVFHKWKEDEKGQKQYVDFLRDMLKDKPYIHLVYMTGILPIKKFGTHSGLDMFTELSMTNPRLISGNLGFIEGEVADLCEKYGMNLEEVKNWYDGYSCKGTSSIYNPYSIVNCITHRKADDYWIRHQPPAELHSYIDMDFEGLKDDIQSLMAGELVMVNTGTFANDMTSFKIADDVLTLLIHLGYLDYNFDYKSVVIPNKEIRGVFAKIVDKYTERECAWIKLSNS